MYSYEDRIRAVKLGTKPANAPPPSRGLIHSVRFNELAPSAYIRDVLEHHAGPDAPCSTQQPDRIGTTKDRSKQC